MGQPGALHRVRPWVGVGPESQTFLAVRLWEATYLPQPCAQETAPLPAPPG